MRLAIGVSSTIGSKLLAAEEEYGGFSAGRVVSAEGAEAPCVAALDSTRRRHSALTAAFSDFGAIFDERIDDESLRGGGGRLPPPLPGAERGAVRGIGLVSQSTPGCGPPQAVQWCARWQTTRVQRF